MRVSGGDAFVGAGNLVGPVLVRAEVHLVQPGAKLRPLRTPDGVVFVGVGEIGILDFLLNSARSRWGMVGLNFLSRARVDGVLAGRRDIASSAYGNPVTTRGPQPMV